MLTMYVFVIVGQLLYISQGCPRSSLDLTRRIIIMKVVIAACVLLAFIVLVNAGKYTERAICNEFISYLVILVS